MKSIANVPIKILKLDDGFHLLITIRVNNKKANVLIDTGASKTVFDTERIKNFISENNFEPHHKLSTGLGTSTMESQLTMIGKIAIGKIEIKNYKTIVLDLSNINNSYAQLKKQPIDGVLGSDILRKLRGVIDFGKKMLKLSI